MVLAELLCKLDTQICGQIEHLQCLLLGHHIHLIIAANIAELTEAF